MCCLACRPPFSEIANSKTVNVLFKIIVAVAINGQRPKVPADFPRPLKEVVLKCWSEDPRQRPSCVELVKTFEELINKELDARSALQQARSQGSSVGDRASSSANANALTPSGSSVTRGGGGGAGAETLYKGKSSSSSTAGGGVDRKLSAASASSQTREQITTDLKNFRNGFVGGSSSDRAGPSFSSSAQSAAVLASSAASIAENSATTISYDQSLVSGRVSPPPAVASKASRNQPLFAGFFSKLCNGAQQPIDQQKQKQPHGDPEASFVCSANGDTDPGSGNFTNCAESSCNHSQGSLHMMPAAPPAAATEGSSPQLQGSVSKRCTSGNAGSISNVIIADAVCCGTPSCNGPLQAAGPGGSSSGGGSASAGKSSGFDGPVARRGTASRVEPFSKLHTDN